MCLLNLLIHSCDRQFIEHPFNGRHYGKYYHSGERSHLLPAPTPHPDEQTLENAQGHGVSVL